MVSNPPLDGVGDASCQKMDVEVVRVVVLYHQICHAVLSVFLDYLLEVQQEVVVLVGTKHVAVKFLVFVEILAELVVDFFLVGNLLGLLHHEFRLEDVSQQVILVPEVIVEGLAAHAVILANISDCNLFQGNFLHQFLE